MKILLLHQKLGFQGGAEQYIYNTAPSIRKYHQLEFAYIENTDVGSEQFIEAFDGVHCLATYHWSIQKLVDSVKPDLIYIHNIANIVCLEELQSISIPKVRMIHDHESYCMRGYRYFPWNRKVCTKKAGFPCLFPCMAPIKRDRTARPFGFRWESWRDKMHEISLNQKLDAFFVGSEFMKKELILQDFNSEKIQIIPPVPLPAQSTIQSSFSPENIILFIGQVIRGKGLDCLIEALNKVQTPWRLCVIGQGTHLDFCKQRALALGLNERIDFVGYLPQTEILDYMSEATMLAVPSVWPEPFGAVGLEAMRQGLPVIAFDSGGIRDWLIHEKTGYLVPNQDITTFAQRIESLLLNKDQAKLMGEAGKNRADKEFSFEEHMDSLVTKLESISKQI